jgi:hypothetical protein
MVGSTRLLSGERNAPLAAGLRTRDGLWPSASAGLAKSCFAARCQRFPPQQLHFARQPGIGEPVDSAHRAAHLLVEAAGWRVDILGLDLEPSAAAAPAQAPADWKSADPMPAPRSPGETRMSHSTATSARPPSMLRPGVLTAITAPRPARRPGGRRRAPSSRCQSAQASTSAPNPRWRRSP